MYNNEKEKLTEFAFLNGISKQQVDDFFEKLKESKTDLRSLDKETKQLLEESLSKDITESINSFLKSKEE